MGFNCLMLRRCLLHLPGKRIVLQHQLVSRRSYAERKVVVKKFQPSLTEAGRIVEEPVAKPISTYEENFTRLQQERKEDEIKVRKLKKIDKLILVWMGKFKSIDDVPDQLHYKSTADGAKAKNEVKEYLTDRGFKFYIAADYLLVGLTVLFCSIAFYLYFKHQKQNNMVTDLNQE